MNSTTANGNHHRFSWPGKHRFAFSIFDDTDNATVDNVKPVYDFLSKLGIRTTKSVWPLPSDRSESAWGQSLQDSEYLEFIRDLHARGFEIAFHGARSGINSRSVTLEGLDEFRRIIGHDPRSFAHHSVNLENLYWGANRCNIPFLKPLARRFSERPAFYGNVKDSEFYWADICQERIKYVRNFGFRTPNVLSSDPYTPYHDPVRPMIAKWFSVGFGLSPHNADTLFSPEQIGEWERAGAMVFFMVHFAHSFSKEGNVEPAFQRGFERLAASSGWFAPVSDILDHIEQTRGAHTLTRHQAAMLELRWARDMGIKVMSGSVRRALNGRSG